MIYSFEWIFLRNTVLWNLPKASLDFFLSTIPTKMTLKFGLLSSLNIHNAAFETDQKIAKDR